MCIRIQPGLRLKPSCTPALAPGFPAGRVMPAERILSKFTQPLAGFFQSLSAGWAGTEGSVRRPFTVLLPTSSRQGGPGVCLGGGQPRPARLRLLRRPEPRLPSWLTAQLEPGRLVPASRVSACAASGPSSPSSSAGLRTQLPTENSPSLVPGAPLAGGLATSNLVF